MPLVSLSDLLRNARRDGYGVGYFEAWDSYSLEAVLEAAEEEASPVILGFGGMMTDTGWLDNGGVELLGAVGRVAAQRARVPVSLLLNEAQTFDQAVRGMEAGFNAVMLDTSAWGWEEAIENVARLTRLAHARGVTVEAEVGRLPDATEDGIDASGVQLTDPARAAAFLAATGADCLAVSIGNVHLLTAQYAPVDLALLEAIHRHVSVPLVLHGGTGLPPGCIPRAIACGVAKFNVGTILKSTFLQALQETVAITRCAGTRSPSVNVHDVLGSHKDTDVFTRAKAAMKASVRERIRLYGGSGRARERGEEALVTDESISRKLGRYRDMLLIRRFEERCNALFLQGKIPSTLHLYIGQEAIAVGVCSALRPDDYLFGTHRPHGHALAKGVRPQAIMAELFARVGGCCKAKGGSMHVGDVSVGMFPAIAIVGANAPIATGAALSAKMRGSGQVAVCFFGEGGANEGAVHEAMNMAAIWRLPVLFVCENNLYGASTPVSQVVAVADIADRAAAYGMPGIVVDGNDVLTVERTAQAAVDRARRGEGPTLIECKTYRLCGHSRSDACNYRTREEEADWREKDPLTRLARNLVTEIGAAAQEDLERIEREVIQLIDEAVAFAEASPPPRPEDALLHVYWAD